MPATRLSVLAMGRVGGVTPYRDQLELLKVGVSTATGALEGLLDAQASCAYTVGDVDNARELFEFPEQRLGDERVIAGTAVVVGGVACDVVS